MKELKKNAYRMLFLLLAVTVWSCNEDEDNVPADTEAPVITLVGPAVVNLNVGDAYTDQGATATDNVDGDISADIIVGGDAVDSNTTGTYTITYNVTDEAGNAATEVSRTVIVSLDADTEAPVITLLGDASVTLTEGDEYTDAGATATDDRDGDLTADIIVGGDAVDTATPGTYVITYNVSDAAGNPATEVTREVIVEEAPPTCTPDEAQSLTAANLNLTFATDPADFIINDGVAYAYVDNPVFIDDVNSSCKVAEIKRNPGFAFANNQFVVDGTFDFTSNSGFTLKVLGATNAFNVLLKLEGPGQAPVEVAKTTAPGDNVWNELTFDFSSDASNKYNKIVLFFDINTDSDGTYYMDDLGLYGEGGGDTTPPVITLNGNATINLAIGATFEDPGATATDNIDGDITANIQVGGDQVDTNTEGVYAITYDVSDAAGNAANQVTRTVNVTQDGSPGNLVENGDFETGDGTAGWLFFQNGGTSAVDNTTSNGGGSASGKLTISAPGNPALKQERKGAGSVQAGDVVQVQFDHIGSLTQPGPVFNVLLFGETADGASFTHVFNPAPSLTDSWTTFTGTFTIPGGTDVSGGLSLLIQAVCGGDAGCSVSANVDNVSITLNP